MSVYVPIEPEPKKPERHFAKLARLHRGHLTGEEIEETINAFNKGACSYESCGEFTISYKDKLIMKSNEAATQLLQARIPNDVGRVQTGLDAAAGKGWNSCSNVWTYEIKTHEEAAQVLKHFTDQGIPGRYTYDEFRKHFIFEFDWSVEGEANMRKKGNWDMYWVLVGLASLALITIGLVVRLYHG